MWVKNFRHKKLQTVMIFLIITLCSLLLTASVSILISLDEPFQEFAKECESSSAIVYPYSGEDKDVVAMGDQFAQLYEVERVEYNRIHSISEEFTHNGEKIDSFSNLTEYNAAVYKNVRYIEGDKKVIDTLKVNECILPACISNEYKIYTGDKIKIQFTSGEMNYTVKGIYSEVYNTSTAYSSDILVKQIPENIDSRLIIEIYGKDKIKGSEIEDAYREKFDGQINGNIRILEKMIENSLLPAHIVGAIFLAIGLIMLLVSGLIINFMIRNTMITDAKTIAVYKTIGYTSSDVLKIYLTYYFIVVSAACIFGIGSSVFISNIILSSVYQNIGQVVTNSILIPGSLCYILTVSLVLGIIYIIMGKTKKVKPVNALNGISNTNTKKKKKYKGNSKIQFSALGIALRTIARDKKSAISIVITAIVTIFSVNFAIISLDVAYTMKENNDYWLGIDKSDVMIGVSDSAQYEAVQKVIEEDARVDYYIPNNLDCNVTLKWKKGMNITTMTVFVYDDFSKTNLPIIKGNNPNTGKEIAISSKVAEELNKEIGDYIGVYLEGEKRVDLLVTGIFQTYYDMGKACRMTTAVYSENNYDFEYNNYSVFLKKAEDVNTFIKDMKEKIGGSGNVIARTEAFSSIMDMIVTPQRSAVPPVTALVLLIGGINIFCIVLLKNANSEKTNGIYKCLGYSTGHLVLSNLYYVGIIAGAAIALAVPMIIILYPSIMKISLGMFGFIKYPVTYNFVHIAVANVVVLIIFILSTLISSRSLKKVSVRDLVQE